MAQDELAAQHGQEVRFPAAGQAEGQHVFGPLHEAAFQEGWPLSADFGRQLLLVESAQGLSGRQSGLFEQAFPAAFLAIRGLCLAQIQEEAAAVPPLSLGARQGLRIALGHGG